jgi:Zn-dependent peptidase ImmA (M78 family)
MEEEANAFAGEFLMPADEIRLQLTNATLPKLASLKPYWRASMAALLHRAGELGTVSDRTYRFRWMQMGRAGYRYREPAELDLSPEPPTLLHDLIRLHLDSFGYSLEQLADLLFLSKDELQSEYGLVEKGHAARPRMRVVR